MNSKAKQLTETTHMEVNRDLTPETFRQGLRVPKSMEEVSEDFGNEVLGNLFEGFQKDATNESLKAELDFQLTESWKRSNELNKEIKDLESDNQRLLEERRSADLLNTNCLKSIHKLLAIIQGGKESGDLELWEDEKEDCLEACDIAGVTLDQRLKFEL